MHGHHRYGAGRALVVEETKVKMLADYRFEGLNQLLEKEVENLMPSVWRCLHKMSFKRSFSIMARFGLLDGRQWTLGEIAKHFGVSPTTSTEWVYSGMVQLRKELIDCGAIKSKEIKYFYERGTWRDTELANATPVQFSPIQYREFR